MGIPSGKVTKKVTRPQKVTHQQQQVAAKKKKPVQKQVQDSISETISFVIKGKLTPIKPTVVKKYAFKKEKKPALIKTLEVFKEEPSKIKEEATPSKQQRLKNIKKEEPAKTSKKATSKLKKKSAALVDKKGSKPPTKKVAAKKLPIQSKIEQAPESEKETKSAPIKKIQVESRIKQGKVNAKVKKVIAKKVTKAKVRRKKLPDKTKQIKSTVKNEDVLNADDTSSTSDEITLDLLRKQEGNVKTEKEDVQPSQIKAEHSSDSDSKGPKKKKIVAAATKMTVLKKKLLTGGKDVVQRKGDQRRKLKLYSMWTGPKRHRVASLNALAKVHCLYENESRGNIIDSLEPLKKESHKKSVKIEEIKEEIPPTRILRTVPGLRGVGKHWDMHDTTSSSSEESGSESCSEFLETPPKPRKESASKRSEEKKAPVRKRKKTEIVMDLKDMVVRKRMASLNASAILAASYSLEKNSSKSPKNDSDSDDTSEEFFSDDSDSKKKSVDDEVKKGEDDRKVIEVRTTPNKKVAVIVNQDTDVTITGVYVNSTTRSTHHEGYCSIAGMQYRISATSHTQTAATAVSTETLLQSTSSSSQENSNGESTPSKSYTPLDALSNMQPPNNAGPQHSVSLPHHHLGPPHISPQLSPLARRHGCSSAFSAPPGHYPPGHHHPPPPPPAMHNDQSYLHGYFQPAGPLITVPHGHTQQQPPLGKSAPLSETPSVSPPMTHQPPAPSSAGDSSDNDVIITSVTSAKDASPPQPSSQPYRLSQYASTHSGYPYGYPPHYYHAPPPAPAYSHHDLCYSPNPYLHHKAYPPAAYRHRYLAAPPTSQYYPPNPTDLYNSPPTASQQNQQVITAAPAAAASANSYQAPPTGPPPPTLLDAYVPPPPTLVETYPPPPHYYSGYGPAPPACYSHSPTRSLPYINATYQSCPCPMQSCPKNVHTGPLIGDNKRSNISSITKESVLLPPVALALPLEPASATGPPSPARGSAGMPPPPSPAGATYQAPPTPKHETPEPADVKTAIKGRKARVGKSVVRNNLHAQNTMLLMCHEPVHNPCLGAVKREVESPKEEQQKKESATIDDDIQSKVETPTIEEEKCPTSIITPEKETEVVVQHVQQVLKMEQNETEAPKELPINLPKATEPMEPCVKTVAENVKVKNMKRKLSLSSRAEEISPSKRQRQERSHLNGSYKDLIKKNFALVHINNGKRKLYDKSRTLVHRFPKFGLRRPMTKRKFSVTKEEIGRKSKPLTASNLHNSKQNFKEIKDQSFVVDSDLIENKEPMVKKTFTKNAKVTSKKFAPAILDSLFAKNNVDRTIESVINESAPRAAKTNLNRLRTSCGKTKVDAKSSCKKSTNSKNVVVKSKVECQRVGAAKRKSKCKSVDVIPQVVAKVPRRSLHLPRWSNGWTWTGEPFEGKVFLNSDEATTVRKCYPAMRHEEGDIIEARDCVLLKAGQRKNELPFVAKIAALWENPDDGEMMMSLLWYYRPEHTEQGRLPCDQPDEVFASRHKDSNSVACIEDKCYVLTFNEYCRYRKNLRRLEEGLEDTTPCIPTAETYLRFSRQPPTSVVTSSDLVFFCRRVYDFRQKRIVKNPS